MRNYLHCLRDAILTRIGLTLTTLVFYLLIIFLAIATTGCQLQGFDGGLKVDKWSTLSSVTTQQ